MRHVFFISDKTGITNESLGNALLSQFPESIFKREFLPFIDTNIKVEQALLRIHNRYLQNNVRPIVFISIMNEEIHNRFKLSYVCYIDFFESFLPLLEQELGTKASGVVGMSHGLNDEDKYYKRIDAIDFSLFNDDGITAKNYEEAQVILIGVSRVGKTPTCLYLAVNYGIKAANYPFAELDLTSDKLPKILMPYQAKLFGLTIDADRLHHIRTHRLPNSNYADIKTCKHEIFMAEQIMHVYNIPSLNVSKRSIEAISIGILQIFRTLNK